MEAAWPMEQRSRAEENFGGLVSSDTLYLLVDPAPLLKIVRSVGR